MCTSEGKCCSGESLCWAEGKDGEIVTTCCDEGKVCYNGECVREIKISSSSSSSFVLSISSSTSGSEGLFEPSSSSEIMGSSSSSLTDEPALFYISQHPIDATTTVGSFEAALFSVLASFYEGVSYAWQWSTDGGSTWYDINFEGGVFYQMSPDTVGINGGMTDFSSTWNGSKFRAKLTYEGVTIYSDSATLTVTSAPSSSSAAADGSFSISQQPQNYTATAGEFEPNMFSVAVDGDAPVSYAWQWSLDGGSTWYDINPNGGVFFQADTNAIGVWPGMTDTSSTWNGSKFRAKVTWGGTTLFSGPATLSVAPSI